MSPGRATVEGNRALPAGARLAGRLIIAVGMCSFGFRGWATDAPARLTPAQSSYQENCGGCHGIRGVASRKDVPQLRDEVGLFLCTAAGREYLLRLPNVAFAPLNDSLLADLMNFIVFDLGGASAPRDARAYSAAEVAAQRRRPLKNEPLAQMRADILADAHAQPGCKTATAGR